jgi:NDP-sugar pyrophosphorylase family protein
MLNILIPMAGKSQFFPESEYPFPKPLIEIRGIPMIEYVISYLSKIRQPKRFIFVINQEDALKYHLDNTLRLLTEEHECVIIQQTGPAKGAVCSSLLAVEYINNDDPLIITNADQFISGDINAVLLKLTKSEPDAGVICFESVHPKWSYVRLDGEGHVVETAEKNPISRNAIAGLYYYRRGHSFVSSAQRSIMNDVQLNGAYYVAPSMNELILEGKRIDTVRIPTESYHSFYSLQKIKEFESSGLTVDS